MSITLEVVVRLYNRLIALACACILVDINGVVQAAFDQQFIFVIGDSFLKEMAFVQSFIELVAFTLLLVIYIRRPIFFKVKQVVNLYMDFNNLTLCICQLGFQSKL
jgi:hypothetical protein